VTHDLLLRAYIGSEEQDELAQSFAERRSPDAGRFGH
jgi:naphthoate synthase